MKLVLIRHGKTYGNTLGRYIGRTDEPLWGQPEITKAYPSADVVVSSPMKRCVMTARLIYPDKEIKVCDDFRETDFGDFENKSYEDLKNDRRYQQWMESGGAMPFPNGEAPEGFRKRCVKAHEKLISETDAEVMAYVIHGGTIMAVMHNIFGGGYYDYMVPNLGGFIVDMDRKKYKSIV